MLRILGSGKGGFFARNRAFYLTGWLISIAIANNVSAQISPDNSLGTESSVVNSNTNVRGLPAELIEGGAIRDANLFHSFSEFNVNEAQRVYFANPAVIENILSRVTGGNPSNILGTLGVDGAANLYFLNPNGILFGSNAQLDIAGSFVVSTGDSLLFGDGFEFSAKNPENSPLLTVSVPLGVQYGSEGTAAIANEGNLVIGQDFTLAPILNAVNPRLQPDTSLGNENTQIEAIDENNDRVIGGAERGANLFHSFLEFNIEAGRGVYFANPDSIDNILTRVTGDNISEIRGTLGVEGSADLYFINPHGLFFNQNASLDLNGSFFASTADSILFPDGNKFSALNPEAAPLLTVNVQQPVGLQLEGREGIITNQGILAVDEGQNLALVGGNVTIDGGALISSGGRVDLGGLTEAGTIGFSGGGSLSFPDDVARGDVLLTNGAVVSVLAGGGGSIGINARNLELRERSLLLAGIGAGRGNPEAVGGDIIIDATDTITVNQRSGIGSLTFGEGNSGGIEITTNHLFLSQGSRVNAITFGTGDAGVITINAKGTISVDGESQSGFFSGISSEVAETGAGNSGGIEITTNNLSLSEGGRVSAGTFGDGNAGVITINAKDTISVDGESQSGFSSSISSVIAETGQGNPGKIEITTNNLSLSEGGVVNATTFGDGNAGKITINAKGTISVDGENSEGESSAIGNQVQGEGNSEGIEINTTNIFLKQGGKVDANTFGVGDAGQITINAKDTILADGENSEGKSSGVFSQVEGVGNSGGININTNNLSLAEGGVVDATTLGDGNAGKITINAAGTISIYGEDSGGIPSGIGSQIQGEGNSEGIEITTTNLLLTEGGTVSASTLGVGDAGQITINAAGTISADGENSEGIPSSISSVVAETGEGNSEGIAITTNNLSLTEGGEISASTFGVGNAGAITIDAAGTISADGENSGGIPSAINSVVAETGVGNSEGIKIITNNLSLTEGGEINASTFGDGNAGAITINAAGTVSADGENSGGIPSAIGSQVASTGVGNSEGVEITTNNLSLTQGGTVSATTFGDGNAGAITINAKDTISADGENSEGIPSGISSQVAPTGVGKSEGVEITTNNLSLTQGGTVSTITFGTGDAGKINITANILEVTTGSQIQTNTTTNFDAADIILEIKDNLFLSNSDSGLFAQTEGEGDAGDINVNTPQLTIDQGASISAFTEASGNSGTITITAPQSVLLTDGSSLTVETSAAGKPGDIFITTPNLTIGKDAEISATATDTSTNTEGGGSITINVSNLDLTGKLGIFAETQGEAPAGTLNIQPYTEQTELNIKFTDTAILSTLTTASGAGGSINLTAPETINISGQGKITAETSGSGDAGNINFRSQNLNLADGLEVSASTTGKGRAGSITLNAKDVNISQAQINAFSNGGGNPGSIFINHQDNAAESVTLSNNAKISTEVGEKGQANTPSNIEIKVRDFSLNNSKITASTSGEGDAGNIFVQDAKNIALNQSSISTAVNETAKGQGGNINLNTQTLSLKRRSQISARSEEEGKAGNITIEASQDITAHDSDITTAADRSSGGAINISAQEMRLHGDSDITTNVNSGAGGGGNINVTADSIIAFDDSDILAFARDGRGGNINLNSTAFFGESFRPAPEDTDLATLDGNDRVDVNASGVVDGVITIPDVSFIQNSLIELPENLLDTDNLLANSCIVRNEEQRGNFTIPGAGGLPTRPGDAAVSPLPTGNVRTLGKDQNSTNLSKLNSHNYRPWKSGDPIVEPTGVFRLPNGQLIISRYCP